jgi:hypothetical protein
LRWQGLRWNKNNPVELHRRVDIEIKISLGGQAMHLKSYEGKEKIKMIKRFCLLSRIMQLMRRRMKMI